MLTSGYGEILVLGPILESGGVGAKQCLGDVAGNHAFAQLFHRSHCHP